MTYPSMLLFPKSVRTTSILNQKPVQRPGIFDLLLIIDCWGLLVSVYFSSFTRCVFRNFSVALTVSSLTVRGLWATHTVKL